jgi:hypothetical protein
VRDDPIQAGTVALPTLRNDRIHYSMFDVGRSTCPQCLDSCLSSIQSFDLYADVSTNQMHYAWQAGMAGGCSTFISFIFDQTDHLSGLRFG